MIKQHTFYTPVLLFLCCLMPIGSITAQASISSTEFLTNQLAEVQSILNLKSPNNNTTDFQPSWLEEMEIRTRTQDLDLHRQRYTVRFTPASGKVQRARKKLYQLIQQDANLKREDYLYDYIGYAYQDWLDLVEMQQKLVVEKALYLVYEDIESVLLKLAVVGDLKTKDLIDVQRDLTETKINIQQLTATIDSYLGGLTPSLEDLIPIKEIEQWLAVQTLLSPSDDAIKYANKSALVDAEIALEVAESEKIFDFFQVQYEGPVQVGIQERLSFGAGIKIPFSAGRQLKMEELKLEQQALQEELKLDQMLFVTKLKRKKQALQASFKALQIQEELQIEQQDRTNQLLQRLSGHEGTTPLLALYQRVTHEKQALDFIEIEIDIYKDYIDYLSLTKQLFQLPIHNYLLATK